MKQPPNLPYTLIHPIAESLQPNVDIAPTVVTAHTNGLINEEHCQANNILHQFKSHIPAESDGLDKWSELTDNSRTENIIYHRDPVINNILKIASISPAQYNLYKTTIFTQFFKAIANN
jgi:hypothetical protein